MPLTLCTAVFLVSLYLIENYILFTDNCFTLGIVYFLHNVTYQFGTSQIVNTYAKQLLIFLSR